VSQVFPSESRARKKARQREKSRYKGFAYADGRDGKVGTSGLGQTGHCPSFAAAPARRFLGAAGLVPACSPASLAGRYIARAPPRRLGSAMWSSSAALGEETIAGVYGLICKQALKLSGELLKTLDRSRTGRGTAIDLVKPCHPTWRPGGGRNCKSRQKARAGGRQTLTDNPMRLTETDSVSQTQSVWGRTRSGAPVKSAPVTVGGVRMHGGADGSGAPEEQERQLQARTLHQGGGLPPAEWLRGLITASAIEETAPECQSKLQRLKNEEGKSRYAPTKTGRRSPKSSGAMRRRTISRSSSGWAWLLTPVREMV